MLQLERKEGTVACLRWHCRRMIKRGREGEAERRCVGRRILMLGIRRLDEAGEEESGAV
jgi:hypothetical protein